MNLIIARHGNTFAPDQKSFWVGAQNDLSLDESGRQQAIALAQSLKKSKHIPKAIYCGPLKRTREYASIVVDQLNLNIVPSVDMRLNEIDYGQWSGLTNEEVAAKFGQQALDDWNKRCVWPNTGGWSSNPEQITCEINSLIVDIRTKHQQDDVLMVTSNGRIRYFLQIVPGEFKKHLDRQDFKVATGNVCVLQLNEKEPVLRAWNVTPAGLELI